MANLYELKNSFATLWALIEEDVLDEAALEDAFQNATDDLADKLENCCKYIKNVESDIAGLKEEEKRIHDKRKSMENAVDRLKGLMQWAMETAGEKKMVCGTFTTSIQNNPPKCVIDCDLSGIPSKYLIPQEPTVDKKKMLEDLKADDNILGGVAHIEQSASLRIR